MAEDTPIKKSSGGLKDKKIIIVEDDTFLHTLLSSKLKQLREQGVEVFPTLNAESAYETAKKHHPDVILLDLAMPGKHGLDFLADLRKEEAFKATPVIILSNMSGDEDRRRAAELGVVGYFVKADFALDELVEQIAEVLNKK